MNTEERRLKKQVSNWAARQRLMYKACVMSKADQSALESIPGWRWIDRRKSTEEWVLVAEERARNHGGTLESLCWLKNNGLPALRQAINHRPDSFGHIPQDQAGRRTPSEWVPVAEERARKNGGMLESQGYLNANDLSGLRSALFNRPDLFAHIPQDPGKRRTPSEWVPVAEERARNHGETLESPCWLAARVRGLPQAMRRRPDMFAHIPQEMRGSNGCLVGIRAGGKKGVVIARRFGVKYEV